MNPALRMLDFDPAPMCEGRGTCVRPATMYAQRACCMTISTLCLQCIHVYQRLTFEPSVNIRCQGCGTITPSSLGVNVLGPIGTESYT